MRSAIILHGMPSKEEYYNPNSPAQSNKHWIPWIQRQLILKNVLAQTPELPEPYEPSYEKWLSVFSQFNIDENTILIGHSCGAGFLIRWLSENKISVGQVFLIAPFLDPDHDEVKGDFFNFTIDADFVKRTKGMKVIVSSNDDKEILDTVNILKANVKNVQIIEKSGMGHFTFDSMKRVEFPELLGEISI